MNTTRKRPATPLMGQAKRTRGTPLTPRKNPVVLDPATTYSEFQVRSNLKPPVTLDFILFFSVFKAPFVFARLLYISNSVNVFLLNFNLYFQFQ